MQKQKCASPDEQKDYVWTVYKSDEYDEEGWLYAKSFADEWGPKTRLAVVRTRVWMGRTREEDQVAKVAAAQAIAAMAKADEAAKLNAKGDAEDNWKTLFPAMNGTPQRPSSPKNEMGTSPRKESVHLPPIDQDNAATLFPSAEVNGDGKKETDVLFPTLPSSKAETQAPPATSLFGKMTAAAFSLPSSVINMAGSSSKSAVYGTVQSIKEVSLFALESAQAATTAAITTEPVLPPGQRRHSGGTGDAGDGDKSFEMLSMLSKKFPDLTPVDRSLVNCCIGDIPMFLAPPEPTTTKECKVCAQEFGMTKYRYQCGYCSESFCRDDLPRSIIIRAYGHTLPSKVCENCHYILTEKIDQQLTQWRVERVKDFLDDKLVLYFNTATDTAVDKIMRAAEGTLAAAKSVPIGATAKMAVVSADFLRKYGRAGLLGFILRNEFMQSFATLKGLIGDLDDLGFQDAAIGTYYFMAMNRGERGQAPEAEGENHLGCQQISDSLLRDIVKYAPLALHAIYELDVLDIQRISKLQDFALIYAHIQNQDVRHPSFALLGNKESKTALVLIRGSKSVQDLLTDVQAHPEEIGATTGGEEKAGGFVDAFAHNGMLKAAMWIKDRIVGSLRRLHAEGYHFIFAGHSLGAGCAALLSVMLQKEFEDLQCFAYAVPACVNINVAESCVDFVHSIVLRDDFVPRAKASNIVKLVNELKDFRGCWRDTASEDLEAIKGRAKTLWAPRKREWAREEADMKKGNITNKPVSPSSAKTKSPTKSTGGTSDHSEEGQISSWTLTRNNLIEQMDRSLDTEEQLVSDEAREAEEKVKSELVSTLMEDPKELYIPGEVTHVYFRKGIYEAVHVDRKCDALAHIPVFQNMLSDHLGRNYLSALRIVRDARKMNPTLPEWIPFSTKTRCMCCDSPFTWNSTSNSEAQLNRDQHNCRKCGALVCEGCSEKWRSIPEFGINVPVRVCDRCAYEM